MATSLGKLFVAALVEEARPATVFSFGQIDHVFLPTEAPVWDFVSGFAKQFGKLPEPDTILAHTGEELPTPKEPPAYYFELLQIRFTERELKRGMKAADGHLGTADKDPEAALEKLTEAVQAVRMSRMRRQVVDFRDAYQHVIPDYVAKFTAEQGAGIRCGWPSFDEMTGGLHKGDKVGIIGKKSIGKTWQLLYAAHHSWRTQGACQMLVSNEMPHLQIQQRLAAMEAKVSASQIKTGSLTSFGMKKLKDALIEVKTKDAALWIVDGNFATTVDEIDDLAAQLNPDGIWIDGAYLLKHRTERDRYRRIAENAELIKQHLSARAPVIATWQWTREGSKKQAKKKGSNDPVDLDDIGGSDAIAQVCSIVLGLFENDSVETLVSRLIRILKGRGGEVGQFRTRWDFLGMDFSELVDENVEDLQFV